MNRRGSDRESDSEDDAALHDDEEDPSENGFNVRVEDLHDIVPMDVDDPNVPGGEEPQLFEMHFRMPPGDHHIDWHLFEHLRDLGMGRRVGFSVGRNTAAARQAEVRVVDHVEGQGSSRNTNKRKRKREEVSLSSKLLDVHNPPRGDPNAAGINNLPDHLLIDVFENLDIRTRIRVERVCSKWRRIAKEKSWQDMTTLSYRDFFKHTPCFFGPRPKIRTNEVKQVLERCGRYLTSLTLDAFRESLTYTVCNHIGALTGTKLTHLNLKGIHLTNTSLNRLGRHCGNLRVVNFAFCFRDSIPERGLAGFLGKVPYLEEIDLSENERISGDPSFEHMSPDVKVVKLNMCYKLSFKGLQQLRTRCFGLRVLEMNGVDILNAVQLTNIFKDWNRLEVLRYCDVPPTHEVMNGIWQMFGMTSLKELYLTDSAFVNDGMLSSVCQHCPNLNRLSINRTRMHVTTHSLSDLSKLRKLEHLEIQRMEKLNDAHLGAIAGNKKLKRINIQGCDEIGNEGVISLLGHCPDLEYLQLADLHQIDSGLLERIKQYADKRGEQRGMSATPLEVILVRTGIADPSLIEGHPLIKVKHNGMMDLYSLLDDDMFDMHWIRL